MESSRDGIGTQVIINITHSHLMALLLLGSSGATRLAGDCDCEASQAGASLCMTS